MEIRKNKISGFSGIGRAWLRFLNLAITMPFLFWSCERDIEIKLIEEAPKAVIEATIGNGEAPLVVLTKSLDYFSNITPALLTQNFIRNAEVFVSDGVRTQKLKEYASPLAPGINLYYYTIDSSNMAAAFLGELNKQYALRIVADGKEYTAATTIPGLTKRIDSVWWKPAPPQADTNQVIIMVRATDPPGFGDYIRYFTKRNREPFYAPANSAFDDLFVDGTTYELPVERGTDRNAEITDDDRFFRRGDTVLMKLSNIDKATFDFWRTMEFSYQSVGNPFSTPVKVQSNIRGAAALGYFGGYASQFRTLIIPK